MKKNLKGIIFDVLYVILILVVIYWAYSTMTLLKSDSKDCLKNGFVYGANKQMKGEEVDCDCYELKNGVLYPFHFNKTTWWSDRVKFDSMGNVE